MSFRWLFYVIPSVARNLFQNGNEREAGEKMNNLMIEATKYTPHIRFDADKDLLEIKGESYPENLAEFYGPVLKWIKEYLAELSQDRKTTVNIEMVYFNSNSSKTFMGMLDLFDKAVSEGKHIVVNWYYDEENDMAMENGEDFKEDLASLEFNLMKIQK
jgi:hypothetical protein